MFEEAFGFGVQASLASRCSPLRCSSLELRLKGLQCWGLGFQAVGFRVERVRVGGLGLKFRARWGRRDF